MKKKEKTIKTKKINKALIKKISKFIEPLEVLKCQRYLEGKCGDFASGGMHLEAGLCSACQIREGAVLIRYGVDRFNPNQQIIF